MNISKQLKVLDMSLRLRECFNMKLLLLLSLFLISCGRTNGVVPTPKDAALYDAGQTFNHLVGQSRTQIESGIGSNYKLIVKLSGTKMEYQFYVDTNLRAVCLEAQKLSCTGEFVTVNLFLNQNELVTSVEILP